MTINHFAILIAIATPFIDIIFKSLRQQDATKKIPVTYLSIDKCYLLIQSAVYIENMDIESFIKVRTSNI